MNKNEQHQTSIIPKDLTDSAMDIILNSCPKLYDIILGRTFLSKACADTFDYAMRLRTGEIIRFEFAEIINSEWIRLTLTNQVDGDAPEENARHIPFPCPRGIDVRISDIVWVADAPYGS